MKKIKPIAPTTGKMVPVDQKSDVTIPVSYTENLFALWEEVATGTTDNGRKFSIGQGGGRIWVTFEGKNKLIGSNPKITINLIDLVRAAEELADKNDLISR
jgi:hypothetical protein